MQVLAGLNEAFFHRYRKDSRAADVWAALASKGPALAADPELGEAIPRRLWPRGFADLTNLWRLALPHGFRALYTLQSIPGTGLVVCIEWVGDHKQYDRLFGYGTS